MPQIIYTDNALSDLERLRDFLRLKSPSAAERAAIAIREALAILKLHPEIGRTIEDMPDYFREWPINFGGSGYLARYYVNGEVIVILAIRHQKELDFNK